MWNSIRKTSGAPGLAGSDSPKQRPFHVIRGRHGPAGDRDQIPVTRSLGGSFVVKIFMGPDVGEAAQSMRPQFARVTSFNLSEFPREAKGNVFVGLGFKGERGGRRQD